MERNQLKNQKIIESIISLRVNSYYFYSDFLGFVIFHEDKTIPTAGVNIKNSKLNFYYNPEFVDSLSTEEVNFLVLHELFHLLHQHVQRTMKSEFEWKLSNIAQDMVINKLIIDSFNSNFVKFIQGGVIIPEEYLKTEKPLTYENVYIWLQEQKDKYDQDKNSVSKELQDLFEDIENGLKGTTDVHYESENSEQSDIDSNIVQEIIDRIKIARGSMKGNVDLVLKTLRPSKKNYLKQLKSAVERIVSGTNHERTYNKVNRKFDYLKGKYKYQNTVNVILDTSGSMSSTWAKVLSYVYHNDTIVNIAQVDSEVTNFSKNLKKSSIPKLKFKGGGGTDLEKGVEKFKEQKLEKLPLVILTDGYTDKIDNSQYFGKILVLTSEVEIQFTVPSRVKQIKIQL